jgi:dipeptidase
MHFMGELRPDRRQEHTVQLSDRVHLSSTQTTYRRCKRQAEKNGEIPQVNQTCNVVGNADECGLVIGDSTFGGVPQLGQQPDAIVDCGSLICLALQRSTTAREAITVMNDLMDTCGHASSGESFSIAGRIGEVWLMEVACRIPDGHVSAHANQARIATFPRDDPDHCLYTPDVIDVAVHYGLYPADKDPKDFSFSDIYDPVAFTHARFSEARVWSMFSSIVDNDGSFQLEYQDYASGHDVSNRMPLFVKPYKKLLALDVMALMNSHYEDVGAGIFESLNRPRPLTWEHQGKTYHNERSNVATFRTG